MHVTTIEAAKILIFGGHWYSLQHNNGRCRNDGLTLRKTNSTHQRNDGITRAAGVCSIATAIHVIPHRIGGLPSVG